MFAAFRVILLSVLAAICYGVVHDQITARLCVDYFTIGHPPILGGTTSPTLLGFGWGVIATWWAGLMIGIPLAVVSRAGRSRRKVLARELLVPVGVLLVTMTFCAALGGVVAFRMASAGTLELHDPLSWQVPADAQKWFIVDAGVHLASYVSAFIGGLVLCGVVGVRRLRSPKLPV